MTLTARSCWGSCGAYTLTEAEGAAPLLSGRFPFAPWEGAW